MAQGELGSSSAHHWDAVYRTKPADEVGWFERIPKTSLRLLSGAAPVPASILDVGAGASLLVDALLDAGYDDLTLLDVSDEALSLVRGRLGARGAHVSFVTANVLTWAPERQWDAWHDRAVFHFLVDPQDRARYAATAARAVTPGGVVVIGAFAPDGPAQCSGLPTARFDAAGIAEELGAAFQLERSAREVHRTPGGAVQPFSWVVLRRA